MNEETDIDAERERVALQVEHLDPETAQKEYDRLTQTANM
jgi:hypothetical protein